MNLTDTHCHLDIDRFDPDRDAVLARAVAAGIARILIPALGVDSARRILELVKTHPILYAAVGVHPSSVASASHGWQHELKALLPHRKVAAIGEVGLDYFWVQDPESHTAQRASLRAQLDVAAEHSLPVIIHLREAGDVEHGSCSVDLLQTLSDWISELSSSGSPLIGRAGVLHSFSGSLETALRAIELGFYIGVTGPITYPRAEHRRAVVSQLPLERILVETDAPYLAPQGQRGKRNEPAYIVDIADRIAQIKSRALDEVARITSQNAARLFAWGEAA